MTRFLLDSNAANDYINRRLGVYERACAEVAKGNPVGISMPVLAELLAGVNVAAVGRRANHNWKKRSVN